MNPLKQFPAIGTITSGFGVPTPGMKEPQHGGVDIANRQGAPIPAFKEGVVTSVDQGHAPGENNFGNSIVITDPQGNQHRYSHLKRGYVGVGQSIQKGTPVGEFGNTGAAYSPSGQGDGTHLDYRVQKPTGQLQDPMKFVNKVASATRGQGDGMGGPGVQDPLKIRANALMAPVNSSYSTPTAPMNTNRGAIIPTREPSYATGDDKITRLVQAIGRRESAGSGDYRALGVRTSSGDRAYGKYQVMGANVPSWTKQILGKSMTAQQFLNNPQAQDKVAHGILKGYVEKYGSVADAASAWFSGRPLKEAGQAADAHGTTTPQYVKDVLNYMGEPVPNQVTTKPSTSGPRVSVIDPKMLITEQASKPLYTPPKSIPMFGRAATSNTQKSQPAFLAQVPGGSGFLGENSGIVNPTPQTNTLSGKLSNAYTQRLLPKTMFKGFV